MANERMLKHLLEHGCLSQNNGVISVEDFRRNIKHDLELLLEEFCDVNLSDSCNVTEKSDKIIRTFGWMFEKIIHLNFLNEKARHNILSVLTQSLFAIWRVTQSRSFFGHLIHVFQIKDLVLLIAIYCAENSCDWLLKFFRDHGDVFPKTGREPKTIALYYPRFFSGGIEKFISLIIPFYESKGHRVIFFTDCMDEKEEYELPGSATRIVLKSDRQNLYARLEEFLLYAKKYQIDVFCNHDAFREILPYTLLFRFLGIPVIVGLHGIFHVYVEYDIKNLQIYTLANAVVTLSKVNEKFWRNQGCKAYYIPNPIPVSMIKNQEKGITKKSGKNILWVGRIGFDKQIEDVVPIMQEVVRYMPDAKLYLVGGVDHEFMLKKIQGMIQQASLERNIILCGYHLDVVPFYETADVVLMTSPAEGFSFSIAESKLFSVPLVCYELPYLELLKDRKGYISVPQHDVHGAASGILRILTDGKMRNRLSEEARESVQKFIDYDIADAWENVFADVMGKHKKADIDIETQQIQDILSKELWKRNREVRQLRQYIQNLKK